jgi:hypothetical protein
MSSKQLRQLRQQAFQKQSHYCFYCKYPIWDRDGEDFSRAHKLPYRLAKHLKCTAEHLVARQDGGQNTVDNVVAACAWCNKMRHHHRQHKAPDAAAYGTQVSRLISLGRWHPLAASNSSASRKDSITFKQKLKYGRRDGELGHCKFCTHPRRTSRPGISTSPRARA